jgi:serine/threonine-protein kinase HipA
MNTKPVVCNVFNGETLVGTLTRLPGDELTTLFEYDADYKGPDLSLSLPKKNGPFQTEGLPPFFCNLISEGWLEEAQTRILEARKNGLSAPTRFDILAYFGRDCIGAINVLPREPLNPETISGLKDMASKLAQNNNALVPGVQPKVLVIKQKDGTYRVAGRHDQSTHIAKLQHIGGDFARIVYNEFVTMELYRALLPNDKVSNLELSCVLPDIKEDALLIERFDRTPDGERIEFYELNQLLGKDTDRKYDGSYKEIADFVRSHAKGKPKDGIKTDIRDIEVLFKRLLGMILVEDGDAHFKNYALLRQPNGTFRLSPSYDVVSCSRYNGQRRRGVPQEYDKLGLAIGNTRYLSISALKGKHIEALAKDMGLLSTIPTKEETQNVLRIIEEIGARVYTIMGFMNGDADKVQEITTQFPRLAQIKESPYLKHELESITDCISKRWNGTLRTANVYIYSKSLCGETNAVGASDAAPTPLPPAKAPPNTIKAFKFKRFVKH